MSSSIVLASSSIYRANQLRQLGIDFVQHTPDIEEFQREQEPPDKMAERLSQAKADRVAIEYPNSIIIASDQVAYHPHSGEILRKPRTPSNALYQLTTCSGKQITFYTGICVLTPNSTHHPCQLAVEEYSVYFRTLTETQIKRYIDIEKPLDTAGAFKVEGLGISLFSKLEGDDYNSLIGLPLIKLITMLQNIGKSPLD